MPSKSEQKRLAVQTAHLADIDTATLLRMRDQAADELERRSETEPVEARMAIAKDSITVRHFRGKVSRTEADRDQWRRRALAAASAAWEAQGEAERWGAEFEAYSKRLAAALVEAEGGTVPDGVGLDWCPTLKAIRALRSRAEKAERERDAYRKAKQENDERFMNERDDARRERDELRAAIREWSEAHKAMFDARKPAGVEAATMLRRCVAAGAALHALAKGERAPSCPGCGEAPRPERRELRGVRARGGEADSPVRVRG